MKLRNKKTGEMFNSREQGIDIEFWGYQLPKELTDCKTYTIEELCGEEECES